MAKSGEVWEASDWWGCVLSEGVGREREPFGGYSKNINFSNKFAYMCYIYLTNSDKINKLLEYYYYII